MADRTFEHQLGRLFDETPALPDSELFTAQVLLRLDRGWSFRQVLIGSLGLMGGLIGGAQFLASGLLARLGALGARSDALVTARVADLMPARLIPGGLPVDSEVIWMSAGLAVLALGFAITRAIREI